MKKIISKKIISKIFFLEKKFLEKKFLEKKYFFFAAIYFFLFFCSSGFSFAQSNEKVVAKYLNTIRDNTAELTAFFQQMPKGGDLHNHYSGSIYAETFFEVVVSKNFWLNTHTLEISAHGSKNETNEWQLFSDLKKQNTLDSYKQKLLQFWSSKDFDATKEPSYKHFFDSFGRFSPASDSLNFVQGLSELKKRAVSENVQYIETMFIHPKNILPDTNLNYFNSILHELQNSKSEKLLDDTLLALTGKILEAVPDFNERNILEIKKIENLHIQNNFDDSSFTLRFQTFVLRFQPPVKIFSELFNAFYLASSSNYIVGVNIVAPEHEDVAMNDYWLHCQMFKFFHSLFPNVKYAMHAGELRVGLVKPEELTWHIDEAVRTAKPNRIGHGVDLATEKNVYDLLGFMRTKDIAVELNLVSNEFILGVKNEAHPISLYKKSGVPIVICSDDAGVLRSDLTENFVLLAQRYKNISYKDIKKFVYNSIEYSFIKQPEIKINIKKQLTEKFRIFEERVVKWKNN